MPNVTAKISLDGLLLNDHLFQSPVKSSEYEFAVHTQARVTEPSTPAPYGHRNNQIHIFDEFGFYLIEHHATRLIDGVVFVLWMEEAAFKPEHEYVGELIVGGVRFCPGMLMREYVGGNIVFEGSLGFYSARNNGVAIGLSVAGIRLRSGKRGKRLRFVDVSVSFS
jgi:hypothetical protein